jgi:hypothetical protein
MDGWKGCMREEVRDEIMRRMDATVARGGGGQPWCGE